MVMKKIFNSEAPVIIGDTSSNDLFPPGFTYRMGDFIYTVRRDVTQDVNSPMREVLLNDGRVEIIPIESLLKDMKEIQNHKSSGEILPETERYSTSVKKVSEMIPEKVAKKIDKRVKKTKKKVVKKRSAE